ncbi:MAG TPA: hypothetical protein VFB60_25805 [Ktedonobacteraceae bacterium]|nr:hypothetical protein [Ktedonobacteraceae bacterium]
MAEQDNQERYREEDLMAGGPVSRGASNKSAPMYTDKQPTGKTDDERPADTEDQPNRQGQRDPAQKQLNRKGQLNP